MDFLPRYERGAVAAAASGMAPVRELKRIVGELYRLSMEFCAQKEFEYRDALMEDLDHGGIDPARLQLAFDEEIRLYSSLASHNALYRGEIEFFAMMSALWLFHLHEWEDGAAAGSIMQHYLARVAVEEPEWLGVAIPEGSGVSLRVARITLYLECIQEIAPLIATTQRLDVLYDRFTQRLLAHLGFGIGELPEDWPDTRRFLFGYSDIWLHQARVLGLDFGVFREA